MSARSCSFSAGLTALALLALPTPAPGATFQLTEATIAEMRTALASGDVTSVDLVALYLNRIQAFDRRGPRLNAVSQINPLVFAEAAARDRRRARGASVGPLDGIPFLVKDSFDVAGLASAAGARELRGNIARRDAPVVRALREAGGVALGKTNMWAFAYAIDPDPDSRYAWGRSRNPYTGQNDFGGSSTGSAAATAANLCAFAMGGDTGSSIRLPSARTALVGGRPSLFLLPGSGIIPANVTLDVIGPMTRTVADNAAVMDVVVFDEPEPLTRFFPRSSTVRPRSYQAALRRNALAGKVIGLPRPYIGRDNTGSAKPLDPEIQPLWDAAVARLVALGATVREIDWPFFHRFNGDDPANGYASVGITETEFRLTWQWVDAFYFNEHLASYRYRPVPNVLALRAPSAAVDPEGRDKIGSYQRFVRGGQARPFSAYNYDRVFARYRQWAARDVQGVMAAEGVDLLAFPTAGGDNPDDGRYEFLNALYEGSFLGLPQLSVPIGFARSGRPQGMMLMARTHYTEAQLLAAAYAFEQAGAARRPPRATPPLPGETLRLGPPRSFSRPEVNGPRLTASGAIVTAAGSRVFLGTVRDESRLAFLRVFVNGRKVRVVRTGEAWRGEIPARQLRRVLGPGARRATLIVWAKDVHGNASGRMLTLPLRRDRS